MSTTDQYIREVLRLIPAACAERARIEGDLRTHLADIVATGVSEEDAIARMGNPTEVAAGFAENLSLQPAPQRWRVGAFLVDSVVALPIIVAVELALWKQGHALRGGAQLWLAAVCLAVGLAFVCFYSPVLESRYGQTLGKRLFGLLVVQESGRRVTFARACLRIAPMWVCGPPLFLLDRAFVLFTRRGQSGTDLMAQTIVVHGGDPRPFWARWGAAGLVTVSYLAILALIGSSVAALAPDESVHQALVTAWLRLDTLAHTLFP